MCAWTAPQTWTTAQLVTAADMNTDIRDNSRYLKGLDGVPTIESGLIIDNTDGDEYLKLPLLSTAECSSVLGAEGKFAFDEQTHHPKYYTGSAVIEVNNIANLHLSSETRGDTLYFDGSNWARLAKGSTDDILTQGANDPYWNAAPGFYSLTTAINTSWAAASVAASTEEDRLATINGRGGALISVTGDATNASQYVNIYIDGTKVFAIVANAAFILAVVFFSSLRVTVENTDGSNPYNCSGGYVRGNYGTA